MAPSSFTAGDKILGYKTASLNRVFESSPGELQLPEQATWRLFAAQKWERGSTLGCFQIVFFFFFFFVFRQSSEMRNLSFFIKWYLVRCFCFRAQELLKFVFFENDYYFTCAVIVGAKPRGACVCLWVFCFSLAPASSACAIATLLMYLAAELFKRSSTP